MSRSFKKYSIFLFRRHSYVDPILRKTVLRVESSLVSFLFFSIMIIHDKSTVKIPKALHKLHKPIKQTTKFLYRCPAVLKFMFNKKEKRSS